MRVHKYINDPKELLEQGKQIVSENADNKFVHRVSMVNLMLSGLSSKLLAEFCGDSERTLQTWLKKVDEIRTTKPVRPLKKTDRNQSGSASYYRISGRSTFSGADIYYKDLGRKGFRAKSHVQTRQKESFIQWFHYSRIGRTRCNQVILV
jgi:hypothetical protein